MKKFILCVILRKVKWFFLFIKLFYRVIDLWFVFFGEIGILYL